MEKICERSNMRKLVAGVKMVEQTAEGDVMFMKRHQVRKVA